MDFVLALVTIVLFFLIYYLVLRPDPRLPPCPSFPLPIVGHLFSLEADSRVQFNKWRQELGDVYSLYLGNKLVVVISSYELLKDVMVKKGDLCSDRPWLFLDEATGIPGKGVIMSNGHAWKEQRSVTMSILRNFGMGKNVLAEKIQEEVQFYMDALADLQGKPSDIKIITNISMSNLVCSVIIGQRFQYNDEVFQDLMNTIDYIVAEFNSGNYATFIPAIQYLPGDFFKIKKMQASAKKIMQLFVNKFVKAKVEERSEDGNKDNFVAAYINEWEQKTKSGQATTMDEEHLAKIIWDLFNAGTETAATTLLWCLLYILNYPEIQEKIYAEIESEIGTERSPTIQDKAKLVYLNAFIMECQRLASVSAFSLPRSNCSEITIGKYIIPKGTYIVMNLDSAHFDKKIWGQDADVLKPERFIDEDGKLKNLEEFIPFGIGRRVCPGEAWAKMALFLYLSSMFQRFKFLPPDPSSPPRVDYVYGLDVCPAPYEIRIVDRRQ